MFNIELNKIIYSLAYYTLGCTMTVFSFKIQNYNTQDYTLFNFFSKFYILRPIEAPSTSKLF